MPRRLNGFLLQLLGIIIMPLGLILLAFAVVSTQIHQDAMRTLIAERDERAARAAAAAISQQLHHLDAAIRALGLRLSDGTPAQTVLSQADFLEDDFSSGLAIWSEDGRFLAESSNFQSWLDFSIIEQAADQLEEQSVFVEVEPENQSGMTLVVLLRVNDHIILGAVPISEMMQSTNLYPSSDPQGYRAYITNENREVISSVGGTVEREELLDHSGIEAALRGETGSSFLPSEEEEFVAAYAPVQLTQWALVIEEPWEAVTSPILNLSLAGPLTLAPALLLSILAIWFGSNRIIGPLRKLEQQASNMAEGRHEAVLEEAGGIAEIRNLQETLIDMSGRIRQAQDALRGYISAITDAQEDERKRLARELHDETIQDLIALGQKLYLLELGRNEEDFDSQASIRDIRSSLQISIDRIRRISRGLRPIYLEELGLVPALEMQAHDFQHDSGMEVSFQQIGEVQRLKAETEMALYRIVQESLSNISRHSRAERAELLVAYDEQSLEISIRDDGVGFEPPEHTAVLARLGHYGLIGMGERADLIGAELQIVSAPNRGTHIQIKLQLGK